MTTQNTNNNSQGNYNSKEFAKFYSRTSSAMRLGRLDNIGFIKLAPIFDAYIGREPEKGAKVYNYDNEVFFAINNQSLSQLEVGLQMLNEGQITNFSVSSEGKTNRDLHIGVDEETATRYMVVVEYNENGEVAAEVNYFFDEEDKATSGLFINGEAHYIPVEFNTFVNFIKHAWTYIFTDAPKNNNYQRNNYSNNSGGSQQQQSGQQSGTRRPTPTRTVPNRSTQQNNGGGNRLPKRPVGGNQTPQNINPEDISKMFD